MTAALKWRPGCDDDLYAGDDIHSGPGNRLRVLGPKAAASPTLIFQGRRTKERSWAERRQRNATEPGLARHIRRKIRELRSLDTAHHVGDVVAEAAIVIVSALTDDATVYPAVTPDGHGGVNLFWVAGNRQVEIEIGADLSVYSRVVNDVGETVANEEQPGQMRIEPTRSMLQSMSRDIAAKVPNWRDYFVE